MGAIEVEEELNTEKKLYAILVARSVKKDL